MENQDPSFCKCKINRQILTLRNTENSDNEPQHFNSPETTDRNWHYPGSPPPHAKQTRNHCRKNTSEMVGMKVRSCKKERMQLA